MESDLKIREHANALFRDGTLSEKIILAEQLGDLPGLDLFFTPVPWEISFGDNKIPGLSENLGAAAKDIHSWLSVLAKIYRLETQIAITIDETRLPAPIAAKES